MTRKGILCAGCWTLDNIRIVNEWPEQEALAMTLAIDKQGGGSAHNVSIDLKKLDPSLPVYTAGLLGQDTAGDYLVEQANRWEVDTFQLQRTDQASTSFTDVMSVESTGKRTFFHHTGANDLLTPDHIDLKSCPASILHLGLLGVHALLDSSWKNEPNGWVDILKRAQSVGMHTNIEMVSIDADINRKIAIPCLSYLNSLIINDFEAACLTGIETLSDGVANSDACMTSAEQLLQMGSMEFVVVHFPQGAAMVHRDGDKRLIPCSKVAEEEIKSSVGAGDAFTAGVLYAYHQGGSLHDCVRVGHAVAAMSLQSNTTVGAVSAVQTCLAAAGMSDIKLPKT